MVCWQGEVTPPIRCTLPTRTLASTTTACLSWSFSASTAARSARVRIVHLRSEHLDAANLNHLRGERVALARRLRGLPLSALFFKSFQLLLQLFNPRAERFRHGFQRAGCG